MLEAMLERARRNTAYKAIHQKFAVAGIENWLQEDEKALHFAVGAFARGKGSIIEIGSYQGGSACFLAAGLAWRRKGKLTCIDPHLGAPLWFGTAPHQHTLEIFRAKTKLCGVADWIDLRIAESSAVAAVWPAELIDTVFIDGDHSFLGALKDFECWGPKLRPGGLVLVDDADDPNVPGVLEMIEFIKTLGSVRYVGTVRGIAVLQRTKMPAQAMLDEVSRARANAGLRPGTSNRCTARACRPATCGRGSGDSGALDELYQIGYLRRCGAARTAIPRRPSPKTEACSGH